MWVSKPYWKSRIGTGDGIAGSATLFSLVDDGVES
jgi:hypothetical protein